MRSLWVRLEFLFFFRLYFVVRVSIFRTKENAFCPARPPSSKLQLFESIFLRRHGRRGRAD